MKQQTNHGTNYDDFGLHPRVTVLFEQLAHRLACGRGRERLPWTHPSQRQLGPRSRLWNQPDFFERAAFGNYRQRRELWQLRSRNLRVRSCRRAHVRARPCALRRGQPEHDKQRTRHYPDQTRNK